MAHMRLKTVGGPQMYNKLIIGGNALVLHEIDAMAHVVRYMYKSGRITSLIVE